MRLYVTEAAANLVRTYQFVLLRVLVGLASALALVAALVASAWLVLTLDIVVAAGVTGVLFLILGLAGAVLRPYLLYLVDAGHVAVLTHVITREETPRNQISFGLRQVRANFASVTALFVVDLAVRRVLRQVNAVINRAVSSLTADLSTGGRDREAGVVQGVVGIVQLALNITVGYVDRAVMANVYRTDHENNWVPAKDGVVLYATTWKPVLAAALVVSTAVYGPLVVAGYFHAEILDALGGRDAVVGAIEAFLLGLSDAGLVALLVAVLGLLTVLHYGLVKPGLTALVVTIYLNETADERPDRGWERRLREHSPEYRAFERRADGEEVVESTGTWRDLFLP